MFTGEAFTIADDLPANDPFRQGRDELVEAYEKVNGQKPNIFAAHLWHSNGPSTMSPTNHNGYDERSALLIKVEGGKFRLVK